MHDARVLYMYLASPRRFAQVSSLKSQVSTRSGLPKSQVSSLKYLSVFFIFFSFHDKSNCVYSRLTCDPCDSSRENGYSDSAPTPDSLV